MRDVATKQVVQWVPTFQSSAAGLCARLGAVGLVGAALGVVAIVATGVYLVGRTIRKKSRENTALAAENATLSKQNSRLQQLLGQQLLSDITYEATSPPIGTPTVAQQPQVRTPRPPDFNLGAAEKPA